MEFIFYSREYYINNEKFSQDFKVAEDYGVTDFPVLVYFENQIPNVFEGPLSSC